MWRVILRAVGVTACVLTAVPIFFAFMFRFDDSAEYRWALEIDAKLGMVFAFGVFLIGLPAAGENRTRYRVKWLVATCFSGLLIAGGLMVHHYMQYIVRFTPPKAVVQPAD